MSLRIVRRAVPAIGGEFGRDLHPVLQRVYAARGIASAEALALSLDRLLPVGTLEGVQAAAELLLEQRRTGGLVLVIGDYDADGATSTALVVRALRAWGFAAVDFLVPNRFEYGYGLTPEIVALAAQRRPTLIVTVDNGTSSVDGVAAARTQGIAVLVTDHHLPGAGLPPANVIVNPNLAGAAFASHALAGVGVAFYVMAALRRRLEAAGLLAAGVPAVTDFLDLVALGTVADVVPLDMNNRVLVSQGLRRVRAGRCVPGIAALVEIAGRARSELTADDLGFAVGPRLNAAGRLDDMSIGIRCLLADDPGEARALAARLDQLNQERRDIEERMQGEALAAVRRLQDPGAGAEQRCGVSLFDPAWHQGVVGLVASRVKDRLHRPVVAFAEAGAGRLRGSARSVAGVHIRDTLEALATCEPDLIERFGGHAMAAGLTLEAGKLERFAQAFDAEVNRRLAPAARVRRVETDGELTLEELTLDTAQALRDGGPWGQAFPEPCFDGMFTVRRSRVVGTRHVKMWVEPASSGRSFDAIAFNYLDGGGADIPAGRRRLVYRLGINRYQGERRLQMFVDHVLDA